MPNSFLGKKLKQARIDAGLSQKDVYSWLGTNQSTFSSWEIGKSQPPIVTFLKLCAKYEIEDVCEYFIGDEVVSRQRNLDSRMLDKLAQLDVKGRAAVYNCLDFEYSNMRLGQVTKRRNINVYMQPAAAGLGNWLGDSDYETLELEAPEEADAGIRISGDSMEPIINNDEIVFIKFQPHITGENIGIFILNGEAYCKRLEYRAGKPYLCSYNPKYSPIAINSSDDLRVIGKVLLS